MPYVTEDKHVKDLIKDAKQGKITRATFIESVEALGFLEWEVKEALNKFDE